MSGEKHGTTTPAGEDRTPDTEAKTPGAGPHAKPELTNEDATPGDQERPMTEEEELDEALDDTVPASDPIAPSRIDGPF